VVLLNWRDAEHPQAGGAEVYCHSVAEHLVRAGARVTLVTARAPGQKRRETRRGVRIVRGGGRFGVYAFVLAWLTRHRDGIDAVLDFQNGIPFFSPTVIRAPTPVIYILHHVHQAQFEMHFPRPVAAFGRILEGPVSRRVYSGHPLVAVSPSTREEAHGLLGFRGTIHVVPNGVDVALRVQRRRRTATPTIVCVGRLEPQKRLELLLEAVAECSTRSEVRLALVGSGSEQERLQARAAELGVADRVDFHGHLTADARDALLDGAWLTVNSSAREGWGLSVLEANARGVPALAYRVPGLRDAVNDGVTGWLIDRTEPLAPALARTLELLAQPDVADRYAAAAIRWAASFSWERTSDQLTLMLAAEADRLQRGKQRERRASSNLVTRVDLATDQATRDKLVGCRRTDGWHISDRTLTGLLYGADESDAVKMLARLGMDGDSQIGVARGSDLLIIGERTEDCMITSARVVA
jgi:glycosyltransferase involved in cell wall biosynthesis